jgi:hypothetical protein
MARTRSRFHPVLLSLPFLLGGACNHGGGSGVGGAIDQAVSLDLASPESPDSSGTTDFALAPDLASAPDLPLSACGSRGNPPCPGGTFCELPTGTCGAADQAGTCAPVPADCAGAGGPPSCGCNGMTYANDCQRQAAGVALKSVGRCDNTCNTNADCPPGELCCYPCGIPNCPNYECFAPVNGRCPLFP